MPPDPATAARVPPPLPPSSGIETSLAYRALVRLGTALLPFAGLVSPRIRASARARANGVAGFLAWSEVQRNPARPLTWFHAPSVGEGLQALAVLERVRSRHPDWQFAYTHFSPSAARFAMKAEADVHGYLPWDTPGAAEVMLQIGRASCRERVYATV